jgi:hypothetical protein
MESSVNMPPSMFGMDAPSGSSAAAASAARRSLTSDRVNHRPDGRATIQGIDELEEALARERPVRKPRDPVLRDARATRGRPHDPADDGRDRVCVSAQPHRLGNGILEVLVPKPAEDRGRNGVVDVSGDEPGDAQGLGKLATGALALGKRDSDFEVPNQFVPLRGGHDVVGLRMTIQQTPMRAHVRSDCDHIGTGVRARVRVGDDRACTHPNRDLVSRKEHAQQGNAHRGAISRRVHPTVRR